MAEPAAIRALNTRSAVFPVDPVGPGTWVGVNDVGLVAALLNRTGGAITAHNRRPRHSRGIVIPMLLDCASLDEALEVCATLRADVFDQFRLIIAQKSEVAVVTFHGISLSVEVAELSGPIMHTSSSLGDAVVEGPRRQLFERLFAGDRRSWRQDQERFHRHQWRRRRDISVLMERYDAKTVSQTVIEIASRGIEFTYRDTQWNQPIAVRAA
jgi:hypothetical protein